MTIDLLLAIAHHLLVFALASILTMELVMVKPGMGAAEVRRVGAIDAAYGGTAVLLIIIGILRVFFGIKGAGYYLESPSFWAKMAGFVLIALLSILPTIRIGAWRRAASTPSYSPPLTELQSVRRMIHIQAGLFLLLPVFAAAMARGF